MSRFDYTGLLNSATALITKFGGTYNFQRQKDVNYDPDTGKPISRTISYTRNAVRSEFTRAEQTSELVLQGDIKLLAQAAEYNVGDTVTVDCVIYRIMNISTIQGNDTKLALYLHLRQ
jgi:hypothetical protein|tara:strand:+ start:5589 stop:5942 length:354 start_codon:yes stop_codon:yes gene_type:complete